jgi:energy-coupling factor transport system permease protein
LFGKLKFPNNSITIIPPAILLIVTANPSEFTASLNRIGVPYTAAYAVSLTLRYIPDYSATLRQFPSPIRRADWNFPAKRLG